MKAVFYSLVYFSEVKLVRVFWKCASNPASSSDIWRTALNHHCREKTIWNKNPSNPLLQHWRSGLGGAWSGLGVLCVHAIARDIEQAGKTHSNKFLPWSSSLIKHFWKIFLDIGQRPASNLKVLQLHVRLLTLLFLWGQPSGIFSALDNHKYSCSFKPDMMDSNKVFLLVDHQVAHKMNEEQIQSNNAWHVIGAGADWRIWLSRPLQMGADCGR